MLLPVLLLLAATPLEDGRTHLVQGKLDQVLFDLDGKRFEGPDRAAAADLMAQAGQQSLAAKDVVMAVQFAQMALRLDKAHPLALEVGARAFLAQSQFGPAEDYAERWLGVRPRTPEARLLRGEIALEQGEWAKALSLTEQLREESLTDPYRKALGALRAKAHQELGDRRSGLSELASLERKLAEASVRAAQRPRGENRRATAPAARAGGITVYGTSWCGFCRQARTYFHHKGIAFEDKDVEKDEGAAEELAAKAAAAGVQLGGVPVIDVRGHLVQGFNRAEIEQYL